MRFGFLITFLSHKQLGVREDRVVDFQDLGNKVKC